MTTPPIAGARVRVRRGAWQVEVDDVTRLAQVVVTSIGSDATSRVEVRVTRWRPPTAGWIGSPRLTGLVAVEVTPEDGSVTVRLVTAEPTDPGVLLAAALRCLRPQPTSDSSRLITFGPELPPAAAPLADRVVDVLLDGQTRDRHVRRCDVLVVGEEEQAPDTERTSTVVVGDRWNVDEADVEAWIDPAVHRPFGRRSVGEGEIGSLEPAAGGAAITWPGGRLVARGDLSFADVRALRAVRAVVARTDLDARLRAQLEACGVVVVGDATSLPAADDNLAWQVASTAGRRSALRDHSVPAAVTGWPSVSIVLSTHRPDHIEDALRQIAAFEYPSLEVVIGAHGPLVDAETVWSLAKDLALHATVVPVGGDRTLGEVLQICSDRAAGALVTKVDDDDRYGPQHVWDLVLARHYSGAQIVGKALDWIHVESEDVTVFRPTYPAEKYAPFVAGGTMLIARADLATVGGWRPVPKSVDRALLDRVLAEGGLVYRTHGLGYVYVRGGHDHTASVQDAHFLTRTEATYPGLLTPGW